MGKHKQGKGGYWSAHHHGFRIQRRPKVTRKLGAVEKPTSERERIARKHLYPFWEAMMPLDQKGKIKLLQKMANLWICKVDLESERAAFDRMKHRYGSPSSHKCAVCFTGADVRHHIIELQKGGTNTDENMMFLCNQCHAKIHVWM